MRGARAAGIALVAALAAACGSPQPPSGSASPLVGGETFAARTWNFDKDAVGGLPAGATVFAGTWAVRAEAG
ncbi:MAG TPA: hypothetical protein VJQ09_02045, partial [Candidatus Limnocylindria bacterium]|nr:hypothetical protein [Candidatus Limnocylindria bacterium]